jgi:Dockerin type I domain
LHADFDNNYKVDYKDLRFFANYWLFDYNEAYQTLLWDYDNSGKVDMPDLRVISEYWLSPFDFFDFADFANQWQKKVDKRYYDDRPDLNKDGRVNFKDFTILANEWKKTGSAEPNIQINLYGDGSKGSVEVGISNYSPETCQAFLLIDGQFTENLFGYRDNQHELVNVAALGPGQHQFKVVSIDDSNKIVCSHIKTASFNSPLNYCLCNEAYEVNKSLYFCGFSPDVSAYINVKALDDEDNILWQHSFPGGSVNSFIPEANTNTLNLDRIIFEKIPAGGGQMQLMDSSGSITVTLSVTPKFDPNKVNPNVRALLILPDPLLNQSGAYRNEKVKNALGLANITSYTLKESQATSSNVRWFAQNLNIQYLYFGGHGNYKLFDDSKTLRTYIQLFDCLTFSCKQSDFPPGNIPSWCKKLEGHYEAIGLGSSILSMRFHTLKFAHFECCYGDRLGIVNGQLVEGPPSYTGLAYNVPNDMAIALGIFNEGSDAFYQGWYDLCWVGDPSVSMYSKFTVNEWQELGEGYTFDQAIFDAICSDTEIDDHTNPPRFASDDLRFSGQGFYISIGRLE